MIPQHKNQKNIFFFISHLYSTEIEKRFLKLKTELSSYGETYIVTENPEIFPKKLLPFIQHFDFGQWVDRKKEPVKNGECHFFAIDMGERFPQADYLWLIEYDVVYTGNWGDICEIVSRDTSDLIGTHIVHGKENMAQWFWAKTLKKPPDQPIEAQEYYRGLLSLFRISRRGIEALTEATKKGWKGHFEGLIPTVLAKDGCTISEWGGYGQFTPENRKGLLYFKKNTFGKQMSTMRFAPEHPFWVKKAKNTLYHPVKIQTKNVFKNFYKNIKYILLYSNIWRLVLKKMDNILKSLPKN